MYTQFNVSLFRSGSQDMELRRHMLLRYRTPYHSVTTGTLHKTSDRRCY